MIKAQSMKINHKLLINTGHVIFCYVLMIAVLKLG